MPTVRLWLSIAILFSTPLQAEVHHYQLDNGLILLVQPDHRAPVVVSQLSYRVGSSDENNGHSGVSHLLEHMMFQGTERYGPGEFSRIIAQYGGEQNAFTSHDYTGYYQRLAKDQLAISFELEADRMQNLSLSQARFDKEIQVVMEERRLRTDDNPNAILSERFNAAAYLSSPYHRPIIGWMNDLEHLTLEDTKAWYQRWYMPNNATLVVVGDVEPEQVYQLAQQYYGPLTPGRLVPSKPRVEVPSLGEKRLQVQASVRLPSLMLGYRVPSLATVEEAWEAYALDVLVGILDGGYSARLESELVREHKLASYVSAYYRLLSRYDSHVLFSAAPSQGVSLSALEQALRQQVERLQQHLVSDAELARVKAQTSADYIYAQDSISYQARLLTIGQILGVGWQEVQAYPDRINAVTAEQVRQVARKYLTDRRLTVATLEPDTTQSLGGEQK